MANIPHPSLRALFDYSTGTYSENKFLYFLNGEGYTYSTFGEKVKEISKLLCQYGIKTGEKVGILSQNMPNWSVAYFSLVAFGRIAVPMLPDFSESDVRHILKHSASTALFVSSKLYSKISDKAKNRLSLIICVDDFSILKGARCETPEKEASAADIHSEELASIIYTSGTTGSSKGVMLSHKNLCANLYAAQELRPSFEWDIWLSILPLSHTLETSLCLLLPMQAGGSVYYIDKAPTPSILMKALSIVRPTSMLSVPLIMEKLYKTAVLPKFHKNFITKTLYRTSVGRKVMHRAAGKMLMEKFGGRIRFFGIGGAKLDRNVERFLLESKFPYAIGYGLTETSPLIAGAIPEKVRLGSTGPIVYGVTARLAGKDPKTGVGEIQVKGNNVMIGYYLNPEATKETLTEDGWLRTKDLGKFDSDGWLYIKGRSSSTIIGPSGENIYPEEIESVINSHNMVNESVVTEYKGKLTALVNFNPEKLQALIDSKDELKRTAQEKIDSLKKEIMDYVNTKVNKFSRINDVTEQKEEFEKTATHKIKRYLYSGKPKK